MYIVVSVHWAPSLGLSVFYFVTNSLAITIIENGIRYKRMRQMLAHKACAWPQWAHTMEPKEA